MMSIKFWNFWPPPPCLRLELICSIKFMQPPLVCLLFYDPLPPLMWTSYLEPPKGASPVFLLRDCPSGLKLGVGAMRCSQLDSALNALELHFRNKWSVESEDYKTVKTTTLPASDTPPTLIMSLWRSSWNEKAKSLFGETTNTHTYAFKSDQAGDSMLTQSVNLCLGNSSLRSFYVLGASIHYGIKILGFYEPLPLKLINPKRFTQPPQLHQLFQEYPAHPSELMDDPSSVDAQSECNSLVT